MIAGACLAVLAATAAAESPETALREGTQETSYLRAAVLEQHGERREVVLRRGATVDTPVNVKSISKSVLGALVGIALERGEIDSLDTPVRKHLPPRYAEFDDPRKEAITFRHLLTHTSGLRSTSFANYGAWVAGDDWLAGALDQPLEADPGQRMRYSTGDTHLLAAALEEAVGQDLKAYANTHLFGPLGERIAAWDRTPEGYRFGGNNMALTPSALLAFGRLYLDAGLFDGRRVLPESWVAASLSPHITDAGFVVEDHDYGYLWWGAEFAGVRAWFAWGHGGQYLFLLPSLDAMVLILRQPDIQDTAGNRAVYDLLEERVIPALLRERCTNLFLLPLCVIRGQGTRAFLGIAILDRQ